MTAENPGDVEPFVARDTVALFTPVPNGKVLAAISALNGCRCDVVEVSNGTLAVMLDEREGAADRAARAVSVFIGDFPVLAMERRAGHLSVVRWQKGVRGESLPPGLALDRAPEAVVSLMTGAVTVDELIARDPSAVHSGRMGRWRAYWSLRKLSREAKRGARS